jgi:hypothetical protein
VELPGYGYCGWLRGWDVVAGKKVDKLLAAAQQITSRQEVVDGHACMRVEGSTPTGHYTVWFDLDRGCNIMKASVKREWNSVTGHGMPLWQEYAYLVHLSRNVPFDERDKRVSALDEISDVQLSQFGSVWLPVSMIEISTETDRDAGIWRYVAKMQRTKVDLSPAFSADAFRAHIPNGTKILESTGSTFDGVPRIWRDGKIVTVVDQSKIGSLNHSLDQVNASPATPPPSMPERDLASADRPVRSPMTMLAALVVLLGIGMIAGFYIFLRRNRKSP